ncbi:reverse transcriptase/maturase family protein [Leptospira sp. FAT2]|uniref:reverse transcriptase domain-containing protein n=1 Tax=Leptospira sanjuanensis TaxID=2879643 RepID=UPI001EE8D3C2|nr:reverse transcriptase domain-containing protein [Leptospira sanjuanensis]MCG6192304.1 reverse transcriptase/maturase family protein [Leptospira sanjuanensis]
MENKIKRCKEYTLKEKTEIVKKFREKLEEIKDTEKCLESIQELVVSQIQNQGFIDFNISDHVSPYVIGQALLKLNRKSVRGLDGVDIYNRLKQGVRVCKAISKRIEKGFYHPGAYKVVEFVKDPSEPSNLRRIGIFSTTEKVIQRLLKDILTPIYEPLFLSNSFAYRPAKSTFLATEYISKSLSLDKFRFCVKIDIKKYFDSIDHDNIVRILSEKVKSPEIIRYIEEYLKSSKLDRDEYIENSRGTPQGSVLGPELSNIYLHYVLDKPISEEYPEVDFVRFADDIVFFTKTKEDALKLHRFIISRLNEYKLDISNKIHQYLFDLDKEEVHFLGFTIKKENNTYRVIPNERRIIDKCQKFSNILYETLSKYGDLSVIDLREYKGQEIPKKILKVSIFKQIDKFKLSIQKYRSSTVEQSNIITEIKLVIGELKAHLFNYISDRSKIRSVLRYAENRLTG